MAAKSKRTQEKKVEWAGYLRVNLTAEQERGFDAWRPTNVVHVEDIGILANNGFKFSISWDTFHNGITASLYAASAKLPYAGWSLTAWADTVEEAISLLFYKHYVVCEEDWERFFDVVEKMGKKRG